MLFVLKGSGNGPRFTIKNKKDVSQEMIRVSSRIGLIIGTIPAAPRDILLGSRCKNSFFVFCWAKDDQLELEPEDGRSVKATTAKTDNATNGAQIIDPCRPGLSRIALQARLLRYCDMGPFVLSCVVSRLVVSPCLLACSHLVNNAWLAVSAAELLFLCLTKKTKT